MRFADSRYNRQELMPQFGPAAQEKLGRSHVICIGAGGVKSTLLYYLAAAGVGRIDIIDFDRVELSNLNRQILFTTRDIGRNKAQAARDRLMLLNDEIDIRAVDARVDTGTAADLLSMASVIVEGGDSTAGRQLVNDHCVKARIPMVHASAQHNYGYVLTVLPRETACFRCVFPDLPEGHGGSVPVLGTATGLAGCLGANEVVKLVTGVGQPVTDGYLVFSGFQSAFDFIPAPRRGDCPACGHRSGG